MLKTRWLSTFSVIGMVLIVLGIVGLVVPHFVYDPGQNANGRDPWYYLAVGVLMLVNGLVTPAYADEDEAKDEKADDGTARREKPRAAIANSRDTVPAGREAANGE